ncbi:protein FAM117B-like [Anopheles ziemanni]|uniref:protein FAM117B-like n=1 Tax=Anopheles coustani TaxID=139045 RepID=UPI00265846CA|nr:protein FAM117B-like [Anopheles coustani]XP_058171827.1 protein FAM117B-like [Anopheles ziemanni]
MSSRVRKHNEPMKAFVPVSSLLLRGTGSIHCSGGSGTNTGQQTGSPIGFNSNAGGSSYPSGGKSLSATLSPPVRYISPEHAICGNRSPGALACKGKFPNINEGCIRRTASLDALYLRPTPAWSLITPTLLQLDKATQTEDSFLERSRGGTTMLTGSTAQTPHDAIPACSSNSSSPVITRTDVTTPTDVKMEKVIRQRLQRTHRGEHSVSSQTLSPNHAKASPVSIPPRTCPPVHIRPMRNSVEGLNQEIEKLVLFPGQQHSCRSELEMYSRGTPEGHRAPLADLFHASGTVSLVSGQGDTRSVNTQTPLGDTLSSDDGSQSTSPDEGAVTTSASPRINKFLAREPPDGCEKVNLKLTEADTSTNTACFKPCTTAFQLKPSLGSAFQPLQPLPTLITTPEDDGDDGGAAATTADAPESTEAAETSATE